MDEVVIFVVAVVGGSMASVAGFGIGSLLTPVLAASLGTRLAVAAVSIPHVIGTALRFGLMRTPPDHRVLWRFGMTSAAGSLLGALLHGWAANRWLTVILAALLLVTSASELVGRANRMRISGAAAWMSGALSGLLGGLVGNQGGIRSAALLGFDMKRDTFVATATAIGLVVDAARMPFYVWAQGEELMDHGRWIALATTGVVLGTVWGGRILVRIPQAWFRPTVAVVIGLLGLLMLARAVMTGA